MGCILIAIFLAIIPFVWWIFMVAWNAVVPSLFHGPEITFWQSAALLVIVGMLTGGIRASCARR